MYHPVSCTILYQDNLGMPVRIAVNQSYPQLMLQVLKDLQELLNYSVNNRQNYHSLLEATVFSHIEIPLTSDPLSGILLCINIIQLLHLIVNNGNCRILYLHVAHFNGFL
ncbi:hypothetical protein BHE74_00012328 [Ensete ventricosum]|nr:hypothetical protein BHE74_00012328 [Ensete ventricosum]